MTPPINGQRNNGPILLHQVPQSMASLAPSYQRRPPPTDYVASNLQQILASLTAEEPHRASVNPSVLYRPPPGYSAPQRQNNLQIPGRTAAYTSVRRPLIGTTQQVPQIWPNNKWANQAPGVVAPIATQASIRHNAPGSMQQANVDRQSSVAPQFSSEAVLRLDTPAGLKTLNAYQPPGTVTSSVQTPLQQKHPVAMQNINLNHPPSVVVQVNAIGGQRAPLKQTIAGAFKPFNGAYGKYQNQRAKTIQPKVSWGRTNDAQQFHTPIIWHTPFSSTRNEQPVRLQRPFFSASSVAPTGQGALVQNKTAGNIQNLYGVPIRQLPLNKMPFVQKQRIGVAQPLRTATNPNPQSGGPKAQVPAYRLIQQQQQKTLADKMALLEEPYRVVPHINVPPSSPWQKQMPFTQLASSNQKQAHPSRLNYAYNYPKPPYSPNVQQRLLTGTARMQLPSKGPLAQTTLKMPQGISQKQISPFSPHFITGQNSWPWGIWRNQVSPINQASSRTSSLSRPQAYGNTLSSYHSRAGLVSNVPASPYTVSPQVLLYYYYYPRTINKPLTKMTSLNKKKLDGSSLQKLTQQITTAAFNNNAGETMTTRNPTATRQTKGKVTVTKSNKAPYRNSKQLAQFPYYNLATGSTNNPFLRGVLAGPAVRQFQGKKPVRLRLLLPKVAKGSEQLTSPPLLTYQTAWTPPHVAYPNGKGVAQPQRTVNQQLPAEAYRKSKLTNELLNRPIYIETVPYQLYYQLQQLPSFNTQSSTQQYLSRVLNDILRLRYGRRKKKKKKRGAKEKLHENKDSRKRVGSV